MSLLGKQWLQWAGVNDLTHLEETLREFRALGVQKIMTAFDMDFLKNPHVQKGYQNLIQLIEDIGFRYGTYVWDPSFNGLDDFIWQGCLGHSK